MSKQGPAKRSIGPYELLARLKKGGMGEVYLARRQGAFGFERLVAVKVIRADFSSKSDLKTMFQDEARLMARLHHASIAQVYDFGEDGDQLYLVIEYVMGVNFEVVAHLRPPPGVATRAMAEVCAGLHAAHQARDHSGELLGVVHRDISPSNLMLSFDGRVKILDFGIALMRDRQAPETEHGKIKGKPYYMSPEQVGGLSVDHRSDQFAVGIVLYELVCGVRPFAGKSLLELARSIYNASPRMPKDHSVALPDGLQDAIIRALKQDPNERFPSAQEMGRTLSAIADASGAESLVSWTTREMATLRDNHSSELQRTLTTPTHIDLEGRPPDISTMPVAMDKTPNTQVDRPHRRSSAGDAPVPSLADPEDEPTVAVDASSRPPISRAASSRRAMESSGDSFPSADQTTAPSGSAMKRRLGALGGGLIFLAIAGAMLWQLTGERATRRGVEVEPVPSAQAPTAIVPRPEGSTTPIPTTAAPSPTPPAAAPKTKPPSADSADGPAPRNAIRRRPRKGKAANRQPAVEARTPRRRAAPPPLAPKTEVIQEFGTLTVAAEPYAIVRLNGRQIGITPILRRRIPAGEHEITLISPDKDTVRYRKRLKIEKGQHEEVILD